MNVTAEKSNQRSLRSQTISRHVGSDFAGRYCRSVLPCRILALRMSPAQLPRRRPRRHLSRHPVRLTRPIPALGEPSEVGPVHDEALAGRSG